MTSSQDTSRHETPIESDTDASGPEKRRTWFRTALFVLVFTTLVISMLAGYRYSLGTVTTDWYLFQVARHTAWVLDVIGYRASLETGSPQLNPTEARALLAGDSAPTAKGDRATAPLNAWERWRYRAYRARRGANANPEIGPRVSFILRPSLHQRIQDLKAIQREQTSTPAESEALSRRIADLHRQLDEGLGDPALRASQAGVHWTFTVIPACGAMEIFAIFLAAVLAYPSTRRGKLIGILAGLPLLYGLNILRLACLATLAAVDRGGPLFTFVHEYVWQAVYIIFVVFLWLIWADRVSRGNE